jgi:hypothetical protein
MDLYYVLLGVAAIISAIGSAIAAILVAKLHGNVTETKNNVARIEQSTNGMREQLVEATRFAAQASGEAKGRADLTAEQQHEHSPQKQKGKTHGV